MFLPSYRKCLETYYDKKMLIIISPSKNLKQQSIAYKGPFTTPLFMKEATQLNSTLKEYSRHDLAKLMSINTKLAELNFKRIQQFAHRFTPENAHPALGLFSGDVFQGIRASEMSIEDLVFANDHLRILSGLYGLLQPFDLMQAYRLEMGTKLPNSKGDDLYAFWGDKITNELNKTMAEKSTKLLINLASKEYFSSLDFPALKADIITPHFKEFRDGKLRFLSFNAKRARGLMVRFIVENRIEKKEDLKLFQTDGYVLHTELSKGNDWVFVR
jgi:cytoplasmic iron level regulating protein YaaA (DUF328/UPF0246 family)